MRKSTYFLSTILCFYAQMAFSQMTDGQYSFTSKELTLKITITDNGWTISSATLINNTSKKTLEGKGIYRHANNFEWYEFQTSACNYSFKIPSEELILEEYDCKNGKKSVEYTLSKKVSNWNGTYNNSDSGVLIITNFIDGVSFNYKMIYNGTSSCGGIELSGKAKLTSQNTAEAGNDKEYPITLELNDNKITFSPSCCDGMVGMECLKFFDSDFTKN
jgi:hypothetical protein